MNFETHLTARWNEIESRREQIVTELKGMARETTGQRSMRLASLGKWFNRKRELNEALENSDVVAVCLPLLNQNEQTNETEAADVGLATRSGAASLGYDDSFSSRGFYLILYVSTVLSGLAFMLWGFSHWVVPEFDEIYQEFGISLPVGTEYFLGFSRWYRRWGPVLIALPLIVLAIAFVLNLFRQTSMIKSLKDYWSGSRNVVASWAWHVSLLLDAGLSQPQAIEIASRGSASRSLTKLLENADARVDDLVPEHHAPPERSYFTKEYSLLNSTLQLADSPGKSAALRCAATYYWEPGTRLSFWLVHWLITYFLWGVVAMFVLGLVSLLLPLIAIISGLV